MNNSLIKEYKHVCPLRCPSTCTMISQVENGRLVHLTGDPTNRYTNGKLCAKGFSFIEKNYHQDRLKFPYYQEIKGSGNLKQITWEKAFDLILNEMIHIHQRYGNFLPLALYKGSGNLGVHHFVTEDFFSNIGEITRFVRPSTENTGFAAIQYDVGAVKMSDPSLIKEASIIIIWGANPAATNIHLVPFIIEAQMKGSKVVVIDPIYSQTAELADLFIQIQPSTDGMLANILIDGLKKMNKIDKKFLQEGSYGYEKYEQSINGIYTKENMRKFGLPIEAIDLLLKWYKEARVVSHIIGLGLQKHSNGGQNVRAIQALAAVHGDIGKKGGGIFFRHQTEMLFNNQLNNQNNRDRLIHINRSSKRNMLSNNEPPIEMLWITCANPLIQSPNPTLLKKLQKSIPFVVTVDHFLTPTAKMSNLILPTTTHFEEMDIVTGYWHKEIALNEQAIPPYYNSKSEWSMMKILAEKLTEYNPDLCSFPIHCSEEEYLNAQFNDQVFDRYYIKNIADLKNKTTTNHLRGSVWEKKKFATKLNKFQFYSPEAKNNGLPSMPIFIEGKHPTKEFPFWLITPHHPYMLNSQFHFLNLTDEHEAFVKINKTIAKKLGIFNGEVIKIFNNQAAITMKAKFSSKIPEDIILIYQGWYPNSKVNINQLIPILETDMGEQASGVKGVAFYDTFVNIGKL